MGDPVSWHFVVDDLAIETVLATLKGIQIQWPYIADLSDLSLPSTKTFTSSIVQDAALLLGVTTDRITVVALHGVEENLLEVDIMFVSSVSDSEGAVELANEFFLATLSIGRGVYHKFTFLQVFGHIIPSPSKTVSCDDFTI
jgi:hypothetical protein